jgi:hypothetical protein
MAPPVETALTLIVKADRDVLAVPSLTDIAMLENAPAAVGVPVSAPLNVLKVVQAGLLLIENAIASPLASSAVGEN